MTANKGTKMLFYPVISTNTFSYCKKVYAFPAIIKKINSSSDKWGRHSKWTRLFVIYILDQERSWISDFINTAIHCKIWGPLSFIWLKCWQTLTNVMCMFLSWTHGMIDQDHGVRLSNSHLIRLNKSSSGLQQITVSLTTTWHISHMITSPQNFIGYLTWTIGMVIQFFIIIH